MWQRNRMPTIFLFTSLLSSPLLTSAFYIPGLVPTSYAPGSKVPLNVNHLTPAPQKDDEVRSVFSFDYYYESLHFCRPQPDGPKPVSESLGSILFGDRIMTSPFELHMAQNESCKALCEAQNFDEESIKFVNRRIWQGYNINWLIDGLPAGQLSQEDATKEVFYSQGFALGSIKDQKPRLNNHYDIMIDYHELTKDQLRVVGVLVQPSSRRDSKVIGDGKANCGDAFVPLELSESSPASVTYTYSVHWKESPTVWATRWDKYLHVFDPNIHWFWLIAMAIFVIFLTTTVSTILLRALRKDIARYNRLDDINLDDLTGTSAAIEDGVQEDSGWQLVHGDVFRPPRYPLLLSIFLGNGAQLFVMTGLTIGKYSFF